MGLPRPAAFVSLALALAPATPSRAEAPSSTPVADRAGMRPAARTAAQAAVAELADWVGRSGGRLGASVVDVGTGETLAKSAEHALYNPASNQKLLTAAVALSRLGPDYRYTTGLYGTLRDGTIEKLVLRGNGDPSFGSDDLKALCSELVELGARRVAGDVLVDQSRFDARFVPPAFEQQPDEWSSFRAPVSAVALDRNTLAFDVFAAEAGNPARIVVVPGGFAQLSGSVRTTPSGSGQAVQVALRPDGTQLIASLAGHVAAGTPRLRLIRRIDDPRTFAGHTLVFALRALGVEVRGGVREGGSEVTERLVVHRSAPLSTLLYELGKSSDNFYAEMVLKTLGAEKALPGTSASGAELVVEWLRQNAALEPGTSIKNGSGLFDANRVSAAALTRALAVAYNDPAIGPEFLAQLAVGGVDGTLRSRFRAHKKTRAIRAKTGTLSRVVALSGYVLRPAGAPVAFSLIVADLPGKQREARDHVDAAVEKLAAAL